MLSLIAAKPSTHSFTSHRTLVLGIGLAIGVLIVVLGIPLYLKKVRPNGVYGLRAALQFESNTKWYNANKVLGMWLIVAGVVTIAATAGIWVAKPSALSKSNKLLAGIEFLVVVVPAAVGYLVAYSKLRSD